MTDVKVQCGDLLKEYSVLYRRYLSIFLLCSHFPSGLQVFCACNYSFVVAVQYWHNDTYIFVPGT